MNVSADVSEYIFSFLDGPDLVRVGRAAKRHLRGSRVPALWLKLVRAEPFGASCIATAVDDGIMPVTHGWRRLQEIYASASAANTLRSPVWTRCRATEVAPAPRPGTDHFGPGAQEGHTSALLNDRYWITIGGYGNRGIENDVAWLDTRVIENRDNTTSFDEIAVQQQQTFSPCVLQSDVQQQYPTPVYGHTACAVSPRCVAMVGGVRYGGYRGDVNELHYLHFDPEADGHVKGPGHLRWAAGPPCETSRAYCSLSVVEKRGHGRFLVAFGGLNDGSACDSLEFLSLANIEEEGAVDEDEDEDASAGASPSSGGGRSSRRSSRSPRRRDDALPPQTVAWHTPVTSGVTPPPRFGHTSHWHAHSSTLFVVGGSTGSDLLRDGRDYYARSLHLLDANSLRWSSVAVEGDAAPSLAGRCHAACAWGNADSASILVFGGSRAVTGALGVIRVDTRTRRASVLDGSVGPEVTCERLDMRLRRGTNEAAIACDAAGCVVGRVSTGRGRAVAASTRPSARLSHTGVLAGRNFLVHGGWNGQNLGDTYALRLDALPVPLAVLEPNMFSGGGVTTSSSSNNMPQSMCHEEELHDEDDEEEGTGYGGWDDEDEDDDEDDDTSAQRRMQRQLFRYIAQQAQRGDDARDAEGDAEGRCVQQ